MTPSTRPCRDNTCAVIVTYFPGAGFLDHLDGILAEVAEVLLVDNATDGEARALIEAALGRPRVALLQHPENLGLGVALNAGCRWAGERNYSYVMTFDQDTQPLPGLLERYADIHDAVPADTLGCVGANYRDPHTGGQLLAEEKMTGATFQVVDLLITSGTLVPLSLFHRVGGYREDYFVDLTDHELCLRALALGYRHYLSVPVGLIHSLGAPTVHGVLGLSWVTYNYSALRYYYMARNFILMFPMRRGSATGGGRWGASMAGPVLRRLMGILLSEPAKGRKLYAMGLGIVHGLTGRTGRLDSRFLATRSSRR